MSDDGLTTDEAALVFRRAAELDESSRSGPPRGTGLTAADVEQVAREVGLSPQNVRRALAELKAGTLTRPVPVRRGALGPPAVVVTRMISLPSGTVDAAVDRFLRKQLFHVARHLGDRKLWTPRQGVGPSMARALDFSHRLVLTQASQITTVVAAEPGDEAVCVNIEAHLTNVRRGFRALAASGAVLGVGAAAGLVAATGDPTALVAVPAGAGLAGGTYAAARAGYRSAAGRLEAALERFLDTLEHGPF